MSLTFLILWLALQPIYDGFEPHFYLEQTKDGQRQWELIMSLRNVGGKTDGLINNRVKNEIEKGKFDNLVRIRGSGHSSQAEVVESINNKTVPFKKEGNLVIMKNSATVIWDVRNVQVYQPNSQEVACGDLHLTVLNCTFRQNLSSCYQLQQA